MVAHLRITGEKPAITPTVALKIAELTGTRHEMGLNMQLEHDLAVVRIECRNLLTIVSAIEAR